MPQSMMLEVALSAISLIGLVLLVMAIFSISKAMREEHISSAAGLGWTLLALMLPVLGPVGWFYYHHRRRISAAPNKTVN